MTGHSQVLLIGAVAQVINQGHMTARQQVVWQCWRHAHRDIAPLDGDEPRCTLQHSS
jgi:hypothetical protein